MSDKNDEKPILLPDYLEEFKRGYDSIVKKEDKRVKLPVLSQMTTSLTAKLALMPKAHTGDMEKAESYTKNVETLSGDVVYKSLNDFADRER